MNQQLCQCESIETDEIIKDQDNSLKKWLEKQALKCTGQTDNKCYLLAHADDGVIWGKFENNTLITADEVFDQKSLPPLRLLTLQQCRIFGEAGEILLWRTDSGWRSRFVQDNPNVDYIPEEQILWGTQGQEKNGFTLLSDGLQGLKHAVPLTDIPFSENKNYRPVRLTVHHYINYDDDTGIARIFLSRLVSLKLVEEV